MAQIGKFDYAISQSVSSSFIEGNTVEFTFQAKGSSGLASSTEQKVNLLYALDSGSPSFVQVANFPKTFGLGTSYVTKSFHAPISDDWQVVRAIITGSVFTSSNFNTQDSANPVDAIEIDYDDFKITSYPPQSQLTDDGLLVFRSPSQFIKADKDGVQIKGGTFETERVVTEQLEVFGDVTVFGDFQASDIEPFSGDMIDIATTGDNGTAVEYARGDHTHDLPFSTVNSVIGEGQITSPLHATNITASGNISGSSTSTGSFGNIQIPDDGRIIIGDSGDLQLYHNGNHSIIEDSGTGNLILLTNLFQVKNAANNQTMIQANQGGAVQLLHNNSQKFITNTGGIDITGHITASGNISVSGNGLFNKVGIGTTNPTYELDVVGDIGVNQFIHHNDNDNTAINFTTDKIQLQTAGTTGFTLDSSQNVGIGTTTPGTSLPNTFNSDASKVLEIKSTSTSTDAGLFLRRSDNATGLDIWNDGSNGHSYIDNRYNALIGRLDFRVNTSATPATVMTITGDEKVGIGTTSPTVPLQVEGDISASGGVFADDVQVSDEYRINAVKVIDYAGKINFGDDGQRVEIDAINIKLDAPVTASGDISSSGTLTSAGLNVVGNISASGTIKGSQIHALGDDNGFRISGNRTDHLSADGAFYRTGGQVYIAFDDNLYLRDTTSGGTNRFHIDGDGKVRVYNNLQVDSHITASKNINVSKTGSFGEINLSDNKFIKLGDSGDLQIFHDGLNSYVRDSGDGKLILQGSDLSILDSEGHHYIEAIDDGKVSLYFDNSEKLETTNTGINVSGQITADDDIRTKGDIIAENYIVSSSIMHMTTSFSSGNTAFGDDATDTHSFTGSLKVLGDIIMDSDGAVNNIIDMNNSNIIGVNTLRIHDAGNTEGIVFDGTNARMDVAPIISSSDGTIPSGENHNGALRLINSAHSRGAGIALLDDGNLTLIATGSNVGIGTASPDALLHIEASDAPTFKIKDTTNNATLQASAIDSSVYVGATSNHALNLRTNNTNRVTILNGGNVGIGETSPSAHLHIKTTGGSDPNIFITGSNSGHIFDAKINNDQRFRIDNSGNINFSVSTATARVWNTGTGGLSLSSNSTEKDFFIKSDGNVGIGTTSPTTPLYVNAGSNNQTIATFTGNNTNRGLEISTYQVSNHDAGVIIDATDNSHGTLKFQTATTDVMTITSQSRVGIGTTTPNVNLQVDGTDNTQIQIRSSDGTKVPILSLNNTDMNYHLRCDGGNGDKFIIRDNTNSANRLVIDTIGNVGIGTTSPQKRLHINDSGILIDGGSGVESDAHAGTARFIIDTGGSTAHNSMDLRSDHGTLFRVNGNNDTSDFVRVGIGTDSPGSIFDVVSAGSPVINIRTTANSSEQVDLILKGSRTTSTTTPINTIQFRTNDNQSGAENLGYIYSYKDETNTNKGVIAFGTTATDGGSPTERMRIDSSGNVGIGKTSPESKLHIRGTTSFSGDDATSIRFENSNALDKDFILNHTTTGQFQIAEEDGSTRLLFNYNGDAYFANGNLGIGITSPSERLDVDGNIKARDKISSTTFESGFAGSGFRIETGSASTLFTVDDLTVRGTMSVFELLIHQIRATNGSLFVSNTGKIVSASLDTNNKYDLVFDTGSGYGHSFQVGDLIRAQRFVPSTNGSGSTVFKSDLHIISVNGTGSAVGVLTGSDDPRPGYEYVRIGHVSDTDRQGSIYLTADDDNAPFIDVIDKVTAHDEFNTSGKVKTRIGKLDGITTSTRFGTLEGYGFYASGSAFLEGSINATSGSIGDFIIDDKEIRDSDNDLRLKSTGEITASKALIKGNSKIAGFNVTDTDLFAGSDTIGANGTKIVIGDLDGTPKIALGSEADGISSTNGSGFLVKGDGTFMVGNSSGERIFLDTDGDLQITSSNLDISSATVNLNSTNFNLDALDLEISSTQASMSLGEGKILLQGATNPLIDIGTGSRAIRLFAGSSANFIRVQTLSDPKVNLGDYSDTSKKGIIFGTTSGVPKFGLTTDSNNHFQFDENGIQIKATNATLSGSSVRVEAPSVFLGQGDSNFISASNSKIEISSSGFHLKPEGDAILSGSITAGQGFIGGWNLTAGNLSAVDSDGGVSIDSNNKLISTRTGSSADAINILIGEVSTNTFGIRGKDTIGNTIFDLGQQGNNIAGWSFDSGIISKSIGDDDESAVYVSSVDESLRNITTGFSVYRGNDDMPDSFGDNVVKAVRLGKLSDTTNLDAVDDYGLQVIARNGTSSPGYTFENLIYIGKNEQKIGGFHISATQLTSSDGNFKINSDNETLQLGNVTDFSNDDNSKNGFFVSGSGEFFVGKETDEFIHFDGTALNISSNNLNITASDIDMTTGQFELDANNLEISSTNASMSLAEGNVVLDGTNGGKISLNQDTTFLSGSGEGQFADGKISFNKNGDVTITDAVLSLPVTQPQTSEFFDVANSKFVCLISGSGGEGLVDASINYGTFESDTTITILGTGSVDTINRPIKETIFVETAFTTGSISSTSLNYGDIIESNKPITLVEDALGSAGKGKEAVPLNFAAKQFLSAMDRNHPARFDFYSPFAAGSVTMSIETHTGHNAGNFTLFTSGSIEADGTLTLMGSGSDDYDESTNNFTASYFIESTTPIVGQVQATDTNDNDDTTTLLPLDTTVLLMDDDQDERIKIDSSFSITTGTRAITSSVAGTAQVTPGEESKVDMLYITASGLIQHMITGDGDGTDAKMGIGTNTIGNKYIIPHSVGGVQIMSIEPAIISCSKMNNDGTLTPFFALDHSAASPTQPLGFSTGSAMGGFQDGATDSHGISKSLSAEALYIEGTGNFGVHTNTIGDDEYIALGFRSNVNTNYNQNVRYFFEPTNTSVITGDRIQTGKIQSNNLSTTDGSEFNLNDGTFKLGGTTNPNLSFDGSTLQVDGTISSSVGNIGGFTISGTALTGGSGTSTVALTPGTGIHLGNASFASAPFSVTNAGVLKSTSGTIGTWDIGTNTIESADDKIILDNTNKTIQVVDADVTRIRVNVGQTAKPDSGTAAYTGHYGISVLDLNGGLGLSNPTKQLLRIDSEKQEISGWQIKEGQILSSGSDGITSGIEINSTDGIIGHGDDTGHEFETFGGMFVFTEAHTSIPGGNGGATHDGQNYLNFGDENPLIDSGEPTE